MKTLNCAASTCSRRWAGRWGVPGLLLATLCAGDAAADYPVVPRVQGDQVVIEVATRADAPGAHGSLQTSDVAARVQGRLGDWIPVALHDDTASVRGSGTLYAQQGQRGTRARVELRVLPLD